MGRKTTKKRTIELLKTAKDRLCVLGELDMARELGLIIDKLDPKIIDLEESKELEQTKADVLDEQYDPQKDS